MPRRGQGEAGWLALVAGTAVAVWGWRLELAAVALAMLGHTLLAGVIGSLAAAVIVLALGGLVVVVAPARRQLWRMLRRAWVRRAWSRAITDTGLAVDVLHAPRVLRASRIAAGEVLRVRV